MRSRLICFSLHVNKDKDVRIVIKRGLSEGCSCFLQIVCFYWVWFEITDYWELQED